jgi:hypothetical protein
MGMIPVSHLGHFAGSNRLWFMPGTPAHVSDGTLQVKENVVSITWAHDGAPKHGTLVLRGPASSCRGDFTDTFHAADGIVLHGHIQASRLLLYSTYPAGDGSPDWGWRIELDWADPDQFRVRMFNVFPDGTEAIAVDLGGVRV